MMGVIDMVWENNFDKVLQGLECCAERKCEQCNYESVCFGEEDAPVWPLAKDLLAYMKAQQPRLVTVEYFENNPNVDEEGYLPVWIEYNRKDDWGEYWEDQPDEWCVVKARTVSAHKDSMRYWTGKPTKEQMEAVKWND